MKRITFPLKLEMKRAEVADLHHALDRVGINVADAEKNEQLFGPSTEAAVRMLQAEHALRATGFVDEITANLLNRLLNGRAGGDEQTPNADNFVIDGSVTSPTRAVVAGLRVEIVDKNVGEDKVIKHTTTDADGRYRVAFTRAEIGKPQPDLQARVYAGKTLLGTSTVRYNASTRETLPVRVTETAEAALPSEYETLIQALGSHYKGHLRDLKETDERQDIAYLANKTGWDARAVALAALADQFSAGAGGAIEPVFFYALLRTGVPADEDLLYRLDAARAAAIWKQAAEHGVIPAARAREVPDVLKRYSALSAQKLLVATPAFAGISTFTEILAVSELDQAKQQTLAELYTAHATDLPAFWDAAAQKLGKDTVKQLQVDARLALLTINNAPLMRKVHRAVGDGGIKQPLALAQLGYHRAAKWNALLTADVVIPEEIPGDTREEQRVNYAAYLAAQVRLSYPTATVAEMIKTDKLVGPASDDVHAFLTEHQGKFEIGVQPIEQYAKRNKLQIAPAVMAEVKHVQRVYQITPNDEALVGLLKRKVYAAYHVVRHPKAGFVESFAKELGGAEAATATYDRAVQVHNAVLNVAIAFLTARNAPGIGVHSPAQIINATPTLPANTADVIAYATLENLFGEMDYCACDHCRSILSPAAYLVDLLNFIDVPPTEAGKANPQAVLLDRRPDIQHLPLTCENTNTALPYIDVVNETLEYFIANNVQVLSLQNYAGHDTAGMASEDLLASPQYVNAAAYTALRDARFPPPLPFHQPLENVRRYFERFEVPLARTLERLRKNDDVERGANPYSWRDILMEEVGLSRAEHEILTDANAVPLWRMYGYPNGTTNHNVVAALSKAKQFCRRVGISYDELVTLLRTRFVNPNSALIPKLERLGVSFADLKALKQAPGNTGDAAFDALLPTGAAAPDPAEYGGDIKAWVKNNDNYARIMGLITLVDPTASDNPCNFDNLELRHAEPMANPQDTSTRLDAVEFVRLLRFIRLWKKTGWTIEQIDAVICVLFRADRMPLDVTDIDTIAKLDAGFLRLLPRLGVVNRALRALGLTPKRDLLALLACFAPIDTHDGKEWFVDKDQSSRLRLVPSLYRQLLLNPAITALDGAFADNGYGRYLAQNPPEKLAAHAEALRAAFNLTGEEYARIVLGLFPDPNDASIPDANTPLTLVNVSAIFRRGWLARKLKLSVRELLLLTRLTGLDPFAAPDPADPPVLRFIALVQALKERALKSEAALYLIWNQDLSGKSAPAPAQLQELARALRNDFAAIDEQFAATPEAGEDAARARMTLVYGAETAEAFFALLDETLVLDVAYTHPASTLENTITAAGPKLGYDDFRHRLSHTGLMSVATRNNLQGLANVSNDFKTAVGTLFDRGAEVKGLFFTRYPELQGPYATAATAAAADRHAVFLAGLQPELARRRKRQQALQRLSTTSGTELEFTQQLWEGAAAPYALHAEADPNRPALDDALALETAGLAAEFYYRDTATGNVDLRVAAVANLDYDSVGANPLPANGANAGDPISGVWRGLLEAPETGFYNVAIEADAAATVKLEIDGQPRALTKNGDVRRNTDSLELKAGKLYAVAITVEKVKDRLQVQWETPKRARQVIVARYLYPPTILAPFTRAYVRFLKAASLALGLKLTAKEIVHFAKHVDYRIAGDGWLNALSVDAEPAPATAVALHRVLEALLDYARIKGDIALDSESLLTVLQDPLAATANPDAALYVLTRWEPSSLAALLRHFDKINAGNPDYAALASFATFARVYDAFALLRRLGISAAALIAAATNEPTSIQARDLQAALRARYDAATWRDLVKPINDAMRGQQRDALITYILHEMRANPASAHIDTPDKLFEYFLMDVEMQPCMLTSRVRHALSSVQLFIERCLMNLETRVSAASINAQQWEWMKRYRVWEANRKVFLFPENWLEPELRDDKSPFFKEIESELLQSDITEERAASALLNYLAKLDEVAKLEVCGVEHIEADTAKRIGETDHVIARTAGAHRKYYYRRREGGAWTPWEPIKLDIEDNPVMLYLWNGRLLLFWLRVLKQAPLDARVPDPGDNKSLTALTASQVNSTAAGATQITAQAVLCYSEYYNGKWQAPKTSDPNQPADIDAYPAVGANAFDRRQLRLSIYGGKTKKSDGKKKGKKGKKPPKDNALRVSVDYDGKGRAMFALYNTHSLPVPSGGITHYLDRALDTTVNKFIAKYDVPGPDLERTLLSNTVPDGAIETYRRLKQPFDAPFFYEDRQHVFYVTTRQEPKWIEDHMDIGVKGGVSVDIGKKPPPLIFEEEPVPKPRPGFWNETVPPIEKDPGNIDPAPPMRRFITEDAYIRRGIATIDTIKYGDRAIGPRGAVPAAPVFE